MLSKMSGKGIVRVDSTKTEKYVSLMKQKDKIQGLHCVFMDENRHIKRFF